MHNQEKVRQPRAAWTSRDVLRVAALVVAAYATAHLMWKARALLLTVFLGVLFAIAVSAGTSRLQRWRVPRALGAPLIVFSVLGLFGGFGTWIGPTVREQSIELRQRLPEAIDKLELWIDQQGGGVSATIFGVDERPVRTDRTANTITIEVEDAPTRTPLRDRVIEQVGGIGRYFLPFLGQTLFVIAGIVLVIFLSIYLAVNPGTYRRGALALVPAASRGRAERILAEVTRMMQRWLIVQLIAMVLIGVVVTIVLAVLNVRAAVPLGILAGLLEFIPNIGPILSAVPAVAMGLVDSTEKALWVALAYIAIQFLENEIVIPLLMQEGVDLPPALTMVTQGVMAFGFGFLGLLLAVPILAAIVVAVRTSRAIDAEASAQTAS
jgi:predicted PurR-regulated permease PerM